MTFKLLTATISAAAIKRLRLYSSMRRRSRFEKPRCARRDRVGKTFTMAKLRMQALVMFGAAHNKNPLRRWYHEFTGFFPENGRYFRQLYDFNRPKRKSFWDIYIGTKKATHQRRMDKLRMSATRSLFERRDVVIVASRLCSTGSVRLRLITGMLVTLEK